MTADVLVIDESGQVLSLLRSLDLGVELSWVASPADADRVDIALNVAATYDETNLGIIRELSETTTTVIVAVRSNDDDECRAVVAG